MLVGELSGQHRYLSLSTEFAGFLGGVKPPETPVLFGPGAAALNQNNQQSDKQHTGNNANDGDTVHNFSSFFDLLV